MILVTFKQHDTSNGNLVVEGMQSCSISSTNLRVTSAVVRGLQT